MRRVRLSLVLLIVAAVFQLSWYILMWVRLAESPGGYESTDFRSAYTAGRLVSTGHLSDFYNLDLQYHFQENAFGVTFSPTDLLTYNHPPILIPIQAFLFTVNYPASYWRWAIFLILLLAGSSVLVVRLLLLRGWDHSSTAAAIVGWVLFYPVFLSILKGNDTTFLLLGATVWFYGLLKEDDRLAGLGLALTTIRPQIALTLAIPFLFKRRRVWWWFCAGASLLVVYSISMLGWKGVEEFRQVLLVSARGEGYGISPSTMFNFIGIALRLFPRASAQDVNLSAWVVYILAILLLSFIWWRSKKIDNRHIILAVVLCVFTAPHLHYHDLGLLSLAILGLMIDSVERGILSSKKAPLILLSVSCLLILADVSSLRYWGPYILMLILVAWPWISAKVLAFRSRPISDRIKF